MIAAPAGTASTAVLRPFASVIAVSAAAEAVASSERQNTSGAVSAVLLPHAPTVPTSGAGTPGPQFCPSVFPMRTKSPF